MATTLELSPRVVEIKNAADNADQNSIEINNVSLRSLVTLVVVNQR
jgi:hypothetical protein